MRPSWLIASLSAATATALVSPGLAGLRDFTARGYSDQLVGRQNESNQTRPPLECFEVAGPVLAPGGLMIGSESVAESPVHGTPSCELLLMDHHFANSYGQPFVGE